LRTTSNSGCLRFDKKSDVAAGQSETRARAVLVSEDAKTRRFFGLGTAAYLPSLVAEIGLHGRVLVVAGSTSFFTSGAANLVRTLPPSTEIVYSIGPLPSFENYRLLRTALAGSVPGCIVAIGGGRVIDTAKLLATNMSSADALERAILRRELIQRQIPLIAMPTTAGSGSESTPFAVVYLGGQKFSVDHPSILPDVAVIDPLLMERIPPAVEAAAGLDAISQNIEALLSRGATPKSDLMARRGLVLAWTSLDQAVIGKKWALRRMAMAANLAGRAIAVTRTTIPHALSYVLSQRHGIAHGHAVALSMGRYLDRFGRSVATGDLDRWSSSFTHILQVLGCSEAEEIPFRWTNFVASLGLPATLSACGVSSAEVGRVVREFDPSRFNNSPLAFPPSDIPSLFD
jgi:alcohol dehydrogenase class IV